MNNRHICKAKRKDNNEWVEGYYVCLNGDRHFIYTGYAETDCGTYYPDCHEVIPETVETIKSGIADKLTKDNITIYRVNNIIRIDIKE